MKNCSTFNLSRRRPLYRTKRCHYKHHKHGKENNENYEIPDNRYRPDIETDSGIKYELIQQAILKISSAYRQAVILRDIQELSYEEIAEIMNITVGTVKSRINRGRLQLQKLLKHIYKD
ncbi:MAG: sigma-70 family RNA polymerase sigma factor [Bacteroidetes bacterium]|nr:sigma-70 family RNA polymerase sigma factor [Bacteroidota bacterium]